MSTGAASKTDKTIAMIFSSDDEGINKVVPFLKNRDIDSTVVKSHGQFIDQMKLVSPDILIVEDDTTTNIGIRAIREALGISWTISSILISSLDKDEVHERTEGLGILGSLRSLNDIDQLGSLIDVFEKLRGA